MPKPTPAKPATIPRPGSLPKLPQTIFNLEKKGTGGDEATKRARLRP